MATHEDLGGDAARRRRSGLGTFGGVFTPSVLTILGIILFLRHGWVVGNAGLLAGLGLIALAHAVSVLTSISLAAIATNRRVAGGGDYFLISRSLGPEFGGALGLVLFLAQSVSVAFYCFGFGEAVESLLPGVPFADGRSLAIVAALALFGLAFAGADVATRFQYVIMGVMGAALVSFLIGAAGRADTEILASNWTAPSHGLEFWALFAIFFPAVTGFTQGVIMSGDLAEPRKSLPRGTFAAVATSLVVYTAFAFLFAAGAPLEELSRDYDAMRRFSIWSPLVDAGVIAATLSSALASFLGAPRILQALARDGIFPLLGPFAAGSGPSDNPRRAVALTAAATLFVFALGDLNAVAGVISMFFLISYGLLNFATYVEARGASPTFRPRFRFFHARLSLAGSLLCGGAMLAIDVRYGALAIALMAGLYRYLRSREVSATWADSRPAYNFRKLKETLREIDRLEVNDWSWQPNLLVFGEDAERRDLLARFGAAFSGTSGFTTCVGIVEGEGDFFESLEKRRKLENSLREEIANQKLDAFPLALAAPDLRDAVSTLVQTWGIGPVRANTVLIDWREHLPEDSPAADPLRYGRQLQSIVRLGCHVLAIDASGREARDLALISPERRRLDVWWWEEPSCRLGLLLAYLMTRSAEWEESTIRILAPCAANEDEKLASHLQGLVEEARIDADIEVVPGATADDLVSRSRDAAIVFFRLELDGMRAVSPFGEELELLLAELPICCIVGAAGAVKLNEPSEPEQPTESEDAQS